VTLGLTLRKGHRLRVFESRLLRKMFDSNREEATVGWKKLHNEELHNLHPSELLE
jgi:hypothetical protein